MPEFSDRDNIFWRHSTLADIDDNALGYIRTTATAHGAVIAAIGLFDSDRINCPVMVAYLNDKIVGWGLLRGYLGIYVDPEFRNHGIGSGLVNRFVASHGTDLMFSTNDPNAIKMFRKYLTRGPESPG
jgi:GNAT superfamily N-acetyltransferase